MHAKYLMKLINFLQPFFKQNKKIVSMKRVMIIVWKWKALTGINPPKDIYPIRGTDKDIIIRINQFNSIDTRKRIIEIMKSQDEGARIFVFLHRRHRFDDDDVTCLLKMAKEVGKKENLFKCFLFSDGRDFIYYQTHSIGLLGQFGDFMKERDYDYQEEDEYGEMQERTREVCVYEYNEVLQKNEILPRYFNVVWNYYSFEFTKKIKELRVDLLSHLTILPANKENTKEISAEIWLEKITSNKYLNLRLRSFLNMYAHSTIKELDPKYKNIRTAELNKLKRYERKENNSYVFDDCNANLTFDGARRTYKDIYATFCPVFTKEEIDITKSINLIAINQQLEKLIKQLEGPAL